VGADHHHHHPAPGAGPAQARALAWALALTAGFLVVEVVAGWLTGSLALWSDAGHMATDTVALAVAWAALRLARRPPDARRTYGYARIEALSALFNGGLLFLVAGGVLWEAVQRFRSPPAVATTGMIVVAVLGMAVNLVAMRLLHAGNRDNLNLRGAYLEVVSDLLGSLAVLAGALVIRWTGWRLLDPVLAVLIGLWVLPRTVVLLREAINVLLEGTPSGLDLPAVQAALAEAPEVAEVHDLHAWSLASHARALTAHVVVREPAQADDALRERLASALAERFDIHHVTLQLEHAPCAVPPCEQVGRTAS